MHQNIIYSFKKVFRDKSQLFNYVIFCLTEWYVEGGQAVDSKVILCP